MISRLFFLIIFKKRIESLVGYRLRQQCESSRPRKENNDEIVLNHLSYSALDAHFVFIAIPSFNCISPPLLNRTTNKKNIYLHHNVVRRFTG